MNLQSSWEFQGPTLDSSHSDKTNKIIVCQRKVKSNLAQCWKSASQKLLTAWIFYFQTPLSSPWQCWFIICSWLSTQCLADTRCENIPQAMLNFVPLKDEFFPFASSGSWKASCFPWRSWVICYENLDQKQRGKAGPLCCKPLVGKTVWWTW